MIDSKSLEGCNSEYNRADDDLHRRSWSFLRLVGTEVSAGVEP
jgi:hypothetical protein